MVNGWGFRDRRVLLRSFVRRGGRGNRVIMDLMIISSSSSGGCSRGSFEELLLVLLVNRKKGRCGVKIGRDAAAFFSDLYF